MDSRLHLHDPYDFCLQNHTCSGSIPLKALDQRSHEHLASLEGEIAYMIAGSLDPLRRPTLEVSLRGNLSLWCQRCLKTIDGWLLNHSSTVVLFTDEQRLLEATTREEDLDVYLLNHDEGLSLQALLEDELIMALPIAPVHESCENAWMVSLKRDSSPFSALKSLTFPPSK
jgi:uncharacterized protein